MSFNNNNTCIKIKLLSLFTVSQQIENTDYENDSYRDISINEYLVDLKNKLDDNSVKRPLAMDW